MKLELKDYREKLAILTQRRSEDKEKLKEAEKLKIQNSQLEEYKKKMQEQAADLQRQLTQAKKEKGDVSGEGRAFSDRRLIRVLHLSFRSRNRSSAIARI